MNVTKRQHYIPCSVLKHFTYDGTYAYEGQIKGKRKYYKANIRNSMCAKNIYEHSLLKTNTVENYFASTVDIALSKFHKEIIVLLNDVKINEAVTCFSEYAIDILRCYYRSGAILEEYNMAYRSKKGNIILNVLSDTPISYLYGLRKTILNDYRFSILQNEKLGFIIGDNYLSTTALKIKSRFSNASNRQIGFKDTMILLPVSKVFCLAFYHGKKPPFILDNVINPISDDECIMINLAIYQSSYNKVLGYDPETFDLIHKNIFASNLSSSPITTVMTYDNGSNVGFVNKREAFYYPSDYELMDIIQNVRAFPFDLKQKISRNDQCYCGSRKKHKVCCIDKTQVLQDVNKSFKNDSLSESVMITPQTVTENAIRIPKNEYEDLLKIPFRNK